MAIKTQAGDSSVYNANTNWENERKYLTNLVNQGSRWASEQLNALNKAQAQYTKPTESIGTTAIGTGGGNTQTVRNPVANTQNTQQKTGGNYTPGYAGTYWEDIFADPGNDFNARAYVPGSGWVGVNIQNGKTLTSGLPVGTIVDTAAGAYQITGTNPDGSYQSTRYGGDMPKTTTYIDSDGEKQTGYVQDSYLDSMLEMLQQQYQQQIAANDASAAASTQQAILELQNQKNDLDKQYDALYRQLYLNRRMNEKNLPEQMAAMGYTGGLTESSLLDLQNQYQQSLVEGETARQEGQSALDMAITNTQLTGEIARAQQAQQLAAQFYSQYAQAMAQLQAQANADREYQYQLQMNQQQQDSETGWIMLENGYMPSDEQLSAMGMTQAQAQQLLNGYSGNGYSTYTGNPGYAPSPTYAQPTENLNQTFLQAALNLVNAGYSGQSIASYLQNRVNNGNLSQAEAENIAAYINTII